MTIIDCCISLKMIKKILVVLGVVDMRQLLLNVAISFSSLRGCIFGQKRVCILCSAASGTSNFKHICTCTIFGTASQCPKIIFHTLCVTKFSSVQVRSFKWSLFQVIIFFLILGLKSQANHKNSNICTIALQLSFSLCFR